MALVKGKQIEADTVTATQIDTTNGTISTVNGGDVAVEGSGLGMARRDHQHAVATGAATAGIDIGDTAAEGTSSNLAREDHQHALPAPAAPANVSKSAAAAGAATTVARADHKHDVDTAAAVELTDSTNAEGNSTSLARANHTHAHGDRGGGSLHADATPTVDGFMSAADKTKLDSLSSGAGLDVKEIVELATTVADGNLVLTGEQTIDGQLTSASRILVKNQTNGIQNGIYITAAGAWSRATDLANGDSASGAIIAVDQGTLNLDTIWFCITDKPNDTVGTDILTFALQAQGSPRMNGAGLLLSGNTLDIGANADGSITVNADDIQVGVINDVQHGDIPISDGLQHAVATILLNGFMSAADKIKLNGIATGAEVNAIDRQEAVTTELITNADVTLADVLDNIPLDSALSLSLYLNGVHQKQGAGLDYTVNPATGAITWLASSGTAVNMQTNDDLWATYLS